MKTMKFNAFALLFSLIIILPSCEFGDTNEDPEALAEVSLNLVLPSAITQVGFNNGAVASRNPGIIMQYFEGTDAQQLQYTSYNMPDNTFNNLWRTGLYGGAMKDLDLIIKQAEEQNAPYYAGIGKVLMAQSLGLATSFFGDIPYSDAFQGEEGNLAPAYDTQDQIYTTMFTLLNGAIADFQTDGGDILPGGDDLIFGGDEKAWMATAYALQARYYLHLGGKDASNYQSALTALDNAFTSNKGNAELQFEGTVTGGNPLWQFHSQRSNTMVLAKYFLGELSGDPRKALILEPDTKNGFAPNTYWGAQAAPTVIINYAECKFIEAECLNRTAGEAAALPALKEAIAANMDDMGVSEEDKSDYLLTVTTATLESIISEKYKGLYPQNVAWNDFRRTGLPAITPNKDNAEGLNPGGAIPQRFIYPNSEKELNSDNVQAA
ncbi:SusD/RagB family nutrient-binding outer membrane lipoprotein, partial [Fulvivirga aurantia]|uniref:SusD/RagB family nutrient-binding outer membrane lipoprotein n=1 Tax=Fulvivirga aurantia TaxID=2529383 RepID=UPI001628FF5F